MDSFARARTKTLLFRFWPIRNQIFQKKSEDIFDSNQSPKRQLDQKKQFLEEVKKGGAWFS